jgi:hypothetical protein
LRRTGFGKKYHPFETEISQYITIGKTPKKPKNIEWINFFLKINKIHITKTINIPS